MKIWLTYNEMYKDKGFANPALVIDCNHSNSNKKYYGADSYC